MKAGLLLLAAGEGKRFNTPLPKVFVPLAGVAMLHRSLAPFLETPTIKEIIIASPPQFIEKIRALIGRSEKIRVVAGGDTRQQSARNALDALTDDVDFVVVHDAARPLVTRELIDSVLGASKIHGAAVAALPIVDTVKRVQGEFVEATLRREVLWAVQTPQAFHRTLYEDAQRRASSENIQATDDAALIEHFNLSRVAIVEGCRRNIKITHPDDLTLAEFYFNHPEQ